MILEAVQREITTRLEAVQLGAQLSSSFEDDPDSEEYGELEVVEYELIKDGRRVGSVTLQLDYAEESIDLNGIELQRWSGNDPSATAQNLLPVFRQLKKAFPWAKKLYARRITGLHQGDNTYRL